MKTTIHWTSLPVGGKGTGRAAPSAAQRGLGEGSRIPQGQPPLPGRGNLWSPGRLWGRRLALGCQIR